MDNQIKVNQFSINEISNNIYDIAIGTIGFENRANFIFKEFEVNSKKNYAIGFSANKKLNYKKNFHWYASKGFNTLETNEENYIQVISEIISELVSKEKHLKIFFDISSVSRYRIAIFLEQINFFKSKFNSIAIDFAYSFSKHFKPSRTERPIEHSGPVTPYFAGWTNTPHKGSTIIIGIGYEGKKAMGVWEYLEAQKIFTFVPVGHEHNFAQDIEKRNANLFRQMERLKQKNNIIKYIFDEPYNLFLKLESLASGLADNARLVVVPFGPKIFALTSMLIAQILYPKISLWRISSGQSEKPIEKMPNGIVVGLNATFKSSNS